MRVFSFSILHHFVYGHKSMKESDDRFIKRSEEKVLFSSSREFDFELENEE